jgi:hypothetical protein
MSKVGDTLLFYTNSHAGAIPAPPLRHAHDAAAARDDSGGQSEIERGYQEIFCDTYFQPLSFKSRSESASRGSNPPGCSQYHLAEVLREKSQ